MNDPSEAELGQPGPFQLLSGLIRPKKFGLDPTLQAIALYLSSVPIALRNFEARPFGRAPKNSSINDGVDLMFTPGRRKETITCFRGVHEG